MILGFGIGGLTGRLLLSKVVPVAAAAYQGGGVVADRQPDLGPVSRSTGAPGLPIFVRAQPGSTALLQTFGQCRASAKASATTCKINHFCFEELPGSRL